MRQGLWLILLVGRVSTAGKEEEKPVGSQALTSTVRYLFLCFLSPGALLWRCWSWHCTLPQAGKAISKTQSLFLRFSLFLLAGLSPGDAVGLEETTFTAFGSS